MNDKNKKRCPVCGKYATSAMVDKYEKLVSENEEMRNKLLIKEGLVNTLKNQIRAQADEISALRSAKDEAIRQNERLRNRGFFKRVFNL
jgi:predicted nuclease with TOPRIM domain